MAKQETVLTEQEYKTLETILQKAKATSLPACYDVLDDILSYSFTKFFTAQPTVIKTLLEANVDARTKNEIADFLESLSLVNETLAEIKESRPILDEINDFLCEIHRAEDKYLLRPRRRALETNLN